MFITLSLNWYNVCDEFASFLKGSLRQYGGGKFPGDLIRIGRGLDKLNALLARIGITND